MAAPWKHPKTGVYYFRKGVPLALRDAVGLVEIRRTLRTKDPQLAKARHAEVALEIGAEWDRLREVLAAKADLTGVTAVVLLTLTYKEAHALAGEFYREFVAAHEQDPGTADRWQRELMAIDTALPLARRTFEATPRPWNYGMLPGLVALRHYGQVVQAFLDKRGMAVDTPSFRMLCEAVALALRDAAARLRANAQGDYSPDRIGERFPSIEPLLERAKLGKQEKVGVEELLRQWIAHSPTARSTKESWSGKLRNLARFTGKGDDMASITQDDVARWRNARFDEGISPRTISEGDLAGTHAVFAWAVGEVDLPAFTANPVSGVTMAFKEPPRVRESGFMLDEAEMILRATLQPFEGLQETSAAARRWIPWICAFSGARVGEVTQVHSRNIVQRKSPSGLMVWCMRITPEDGPIKDNEAREIPLHPQIIEQGFLDYVKSRRDRPLFYEPSRARSPGTHHRQSDKVGERLAKWVRDLGIPKPVQPNHAWRHRFETIGRHLDLRTDVVDHITGHEPGNVAASYGDYLVEALYKAICLFPRYLDERAVPVTPSSSHAAGGISILAGRSSA